ncbi:MAG: tetratricopeptide repeat protein [Fimbriimonadaceae bacterium]|nr:tetratricopeptide repeat protein [Fimbriimonadaceae bacterium]
MKRILQGLAVLTALGLVAAVLFPVFAKAREGSTRLSPEQRLSLQESEPSSRVLAQRAFRAERQEEWAEAERLYRQVLETAPNHEPTRLDLARVLEVSGKTEEALAAYRAIYGSGGGTRDTQSEAPWRTIPALKAARAADDEDLQKSVLAAITRRATPMIGDAPFAPGIPTSDQEIDALRQILLAREFFTGSSGVSAAAAALTEAQKLTPNDPLLPALLAWLARETGRPAEADLLWDQALRLSTEGSPLRRWIREQRAKLKA